MSQDSKIAFSGVVIIGLLLQIILVAGDTQDTPYEAAIKFSKAYFGLCPSLPEMVVNNGINEEEVNAYLYSKYTEAAERGYALKRLSKSFYNIHTQTALKGTNKATVHISGTTRTMINPLYGFVAKIFFITSPTNVEETIELVKEDGQWKVNNLPFDLTGTI